MADKEKRSSRVPAVTTRDFWEQLIAAGIEVPANCARIVIDAKAQGVVEIHWQCFADDELLEVVTGALLEIKRGGKTIETAGE